MLYDFTHLLCGKVWNAVTVESFVFLHTRQSGQLHGSRGSSA